MSTAKTQSDGFAMAVVVEGGLGIAAILLAWIFHVSLRDQFATTMPQLFESIVRGLIATLPMLALFYWLVNSKRESLAHLREQVDWLVREMFPTGNAVQFALVAVLAGVGEELLFRGVLQTKLIGWTTPLVGLLLASCLFGLAHALSSLYFAFAIGVGVFLGWLALHYNDLVAPMVAHGLYDFLALLYLSRTALSRVRDDIVPADAPSADDSQAKSDERPQR